jgi:ribonuclease D
LEAARAVPDAELPPSTGPARDDIPPPARWRDRNPEAAARLQRAREVIAAFAEEHSVLAQNLLAGDVVRAISWGPPTPLDERSVADRLLELGARPWQAELCAPGLTEALADAE